MNLYENFLRTGTLAYVHGYACSQAYVCSDRTERGWYAVVMTTPSFQIPIAVFFAEGKTVSIQY